MMRALRLVVRERERQNEKWGEQNHPDADGDTAWRRADNHYVPTAMIAKELCDNSAQDNTLTWAHILVEEVAEAVEAADDPERLAEELVQVAAVALQWLESLERRAGR